MSLTGRCLCGEVQYKLANPPAATVVCHCKNCQRQAGSAFSTLGVVPKAGFQLTAGKPKLYRDDDTHSGNTVQRFFCKTCGSPIYSVIVAQPDNIFLKTGTMDVTSGFTPQSHYWCDSKQDWIALEEGVPTFPKGAG